MKELTKDLIQIHNLELYDYMGYDITGEPQYHHIKKQANGGKYSLNNGAVLGDNPHRYLHLVEVKDNYCYMALNSTFKYINNDKKKELYSVWEYERAVLEDFESRYLGLTNKYGELLIKDDYLVRPELDELREYSRKRK